MEASPPPVAGSGPPSDPPGERGGNDLTRAWSALWQEYRGEPWAGTRQSALSLAQCSKFANGDREQLWVRARRMLDSTDALDVSNASPEWLAKRWNKFSADIKPQSRTQTRLAEVDRLFDEAEARRPGAA